MEIRPLQANEISRLIPLGHAFFEEAKLPGKFNPTHWCFEMSSILLSGTGAGFILDNFQGGILGVIYTDMPTGDIVVDESLWYIMPSHRRGNLALKLFRTFESWARSVGAVRIRTGALSFQAPRLAKFYSRSGYTPVEQRFTKELIQCG